MLILHLATSGKEIYVPLKADDILEERINGTYVPALGRTVTETPEEIQKLLDKEKKE